MRWRAALLIATIPACSHGNGRSTGGDGDGREGRERPIEMLVPNDAETLDPRYATDAYAIRTTRLIHAGLVGLDPTTLAPRPYLATSWRWLDDRTLHLELRTDVKFHSGAAFGARDVIATLAAFQSSVVGSRHARQVEDIGGVTADGDHAVNVTLRTAHATLLTDLEIPILRADEAASPPRVDGSLDGLGPFTVVGREPGAIMLVPAKDSPLRMPLRAVTIRTVHDENARALRVHAGRADLVVNGFSPTLLPSFGAEKGIAVVARPGSNLTYLLIRGDRGPLADVRVRRALSFAIDRKRIAETLFAGHATPASTLLPETLWAHTDLPPVPFDPDAARASLGAPIHLSMLTSTDRLRGTIARQVAQDMGNVGIDLEVVPLELGTMLARLGAGDFELATLQMPEIMDPNILRFFLHSSNAPPAGANRGRVNDAEIDRLLDEGSTERDPEKRKAIYASIEARLRERALLIPLWHEDQIAVTSARAAGFMPSAEGRWLGLADLR